MIRTSIVALAVSLGLAGAALAQQPAQGGIPYVSGGIGEEGRDALRPYENSYNLHLLFALQGSGEYLANVRVKLVDQRGATVLDAVAEGPFFLARVPPGRYKIIADNQGHTLTKTVTLTGTRIVKQSFYWVGG